MSTAQQLRFWGGSGETESQACMLTAADEIEAITQDARWAVNVLLETIAAKFEANDTWDIWRSDAATLVRSFKHSNGKAGTEHEG